MVGFDETTLRELTWDQLKAVARENGVRVGQKREKITQELLQIGRPKMTQLAKLQGDKTAVKMEKIRRRTLGHVKTPPRPASSRGRRAACASTSRQKAESKPRRAPDPEPEPVAQPPQPEAVEASAPVATAVEGQVEVLAKPDEELRPLDRARARYRLEKEQAERERRGKEEAARSEAQPPSTTSAEAAAPAPAEPDEADTPCIEHVRSPRKRVLYRVGEPIPDEPPFEPRARTPGPRRDVWPDEWRVGLLSPDPNNPRPVFSPPTKPRGAPVKDQDKEEEEDRPVGPALDEKVSGQPAAPDLSEEKEVESAPAVDEQENVDGGDTDTVLAEEDEVFEMMSMDNIRVTLPEDEAADRVDGGEKTVRQKKRKAEDDDEESGEEEKTVTARNQSPQKCRRTGLRGWLSKVF